jgi:hypothetical protein
MFGFATGAGYGAGVTKTLDGNRCVWRALNGKNTSRGKRLTVEFNLVLQSVIVISMLRRYVFLGEFGVSTPLYGAKAVEYEHYEGTRS